MIKIVPATTHNTQDIQEVSALAWPYAFKDILSASQIAYMMEWMYSDESLREQMEKKNHRYFLAKSEDEYVGYLSIEHNCENRRKTKIHKIYILPDKQKKGIGRLFLDVALEKAREAGDEAIYLNVNKYNENAIAFYKRTGFVLAGEEVIDIGNGFVMDDFVFEKSVTIE
jgi:Acetyltransferases